MGKVLIMGSGFWGTGETLAAAKAKFTSVGGRLSNGYGIFVFDAATTFDGIDMMGQVFYTGNAPEFSQVKARKAVRR